MANLLLQKFSIVLVTIPAAFVAVYASTYLRFPASAFVIAACVGAFCAVIYFGSRREKTARLNIFYAAANDFGRPVSFDNHSASFERDGTEFDCRFPVGEDEHALRVGFYLVNLRHRFSIQHDHLFRKTLDGCGLIVSTNLSDDFLLQGEADGFLEDLLKNKNITDDLYNYPKSLMTALSIVFDEGRFQIQWAPPVGEQIDGFYQVCQTAAIFHDELKKISKIDLR